MKIVLIFSLFLASAAFATPDCNKKMNLLSVLKESQTNGRSPADAYVNFIQALVNRQALSGRFISDLQKSSVPLNPFDYEVKNLSTQEKGRFKEAFETLTANRQIKSGWSEILLRIEKVFKIADVGQATRKEVATETDILWTPVQLESDILLPETFRRLPGSSQVFPKADGGFWMLKYASVTQGLYFGDSKTGKVKKITDGEYRQEPSVAFDKDGDPIVLFSDGKKIKAINGRTGKAAFNPIVLSQFKTAPWIKQKELLNPYGYVDADGTFIVVYKWWDVNRFRFGKFDLRAGDSRELDISFDNTAEIERAPDGKLYVGGLTEGTVRIFNISDERPLGVGLVPPKDRSSGWDTTFVASHKNSQVYLNDPSGPLYVFSSTADKLVQERRLGRNGRVTGFTSKTGRSVAVASNETSEILIFEDGQFQKSINLHTPASSRMANINFIEVDGKIFLFVAIEDGKISPKLVSVKIFDMSSGSLITLDVADFNLSNILFLENSGPGQVQGYFYPQSRAPDINPIVKLQLFGKGEVK